MRTSRLQLGMNAHMVAAAYRMAGVALLSFFPLFSFAGTHEKTLSPDAGKTVYRYYCYQCHGYSGNAKTVASAYLEPMPRDFTSTPLEALSFQTMLAAVRNGKPGTAMVGFATVLAEKEMHDVIAFIRNSFMSETPLVEKYHTAENGWPNHERYASAFAFVDGSMATSVEWESLTVEQKIGRNLYMSACISCHDQPPHPDAEPIWELQAVSYPRKHYSHITGPVNVVSGASPYALHDVPPKTRPLSAGEETGKRLYQENCAFCHAADGTGRNWIGSFLEPRPRDFTNPGFNLMREPLQMREIVKTGVSNSSMPAWRDVLTDDEIDQIINYIDSAFVVTE